MREYVETWKCIAAKVGRSERWCRYTSTGNDHPLPVGAVAGTVRMYVDDFERWEREEFERGRSRIERGECIKDTRTRPVSARPKRRGFGEVEGLWFGPISADYIKRESIRRGISERLVADDLVVAILDEAGCRPLTERELDVCRGDGRSLPRKEKAGRVQLGFVSTTSAIFESVRVSASRRRCSMREAADIAIHAALDAAGAPR